MKNILRLPSSSPESSAKLTKNPPKDADDGRKVTPEELRNLLESIRERYALDREIWGLRDVPEATRHIVEAKMKRSDAALEHIKRTAENLDNWRYFKNDQDHIAFLGIKGRIFMDGKRTWGDNGPWNEVMPGDPELAELMAETRMTAPEAAFSYVKAIADDPNNPRVSRDGRHHKAFVGIKGMLSRGKRS